MSSTTDPGGRAGPPTPSTRGRRPEPRGKPDVPAANCSASSPSSRSGKLVSVLGLISAEAFAVAVRDRRAPFGRPAPATAAYWTAVGETLRGRRGGPAGRRGHRRPRSDWSPARTRRAEESSRLAGGLPALVPGDRAVCRCSCSCSAPRPSMKQTVVFIACVFPGPSCRAPVRRPPASRR